MNKVSDKAVSQHSCFKTLIQVFNNFSNIMVMVLQKAINLRRTSPNALRKSNNVKIEDC